MPFNVSPEVAGGNEGGRVSVDDGSVWLATEPGGSMGVVFVSGSWDSLGYKVLVVSSWPGSGRNRVLC